MPVKENGAWLVRSAGQEFYAGLTGETGMRALHDLKRGRVELNRLQPWRNEPSPGVVAAEWRGPFAEGKTHASGSVAQICFRLKREVAIKILPDEFSRDTDRISRFEHEAESLAALNHRSNLATST